MRRTALVSAAIAAVPAAVWLALDPPSADLAAHLYRAWLFAHHPLAIWDGGWYSGHLTPAYSVLFPPLAAVVGPQAVGALSAPVAAAGFAVLAVERFGRAGRLAAYWFALATLSDLLSGRLPFALGLAVGLWALVAASHARRRPALALAVVCALVSPVAALDLALAAAAWWLGAGRRLGLLLAAAALAPVGLLALAFPEGGSEPYAFSALWHSVLASALVCAAAWWGSQRSRTLAWGGAFSLVLCVAAYVAATPLGGNTSRLPALLAGPLLIGLLLDRRAGLRRPEPAGAWAAAAIAVGLGAVAFQWADGVRDIRKSDADPSVTSAYYAPLLGFLDRQGTAPFRVEIPFTLSHYEATRVAPRHPLARGWERQLDRGDNAVFYATRRLTPAAYAAWLDSTGVRFVALPDAQLDKSAREEAALLRSGTVTGLRSVFRSAHWQVWERAQARLVVGPGRLTALGVSSFALDADRPATLLVRERFSPYWALASGSGCVADGPGGLTLLTVRRPGVVRVVTRFALDRLVERGPRCRA